MGRRGVSRAGSCRPGSRSEYRSARIWLGLACAMPGTGRSSGGWSYLSPSKDAVDGLEGVALLSGLAGHEPPLMCFWPAVLTRAGVVGVDPAAIADHVAAVASGLAAMCVDFGRCVHLVSPCVWATRPDLTPAGSGRAANGSWVSLFPDHPLAFRLCIFSASMHPFPHGRPTSFNLG